MKKSVCNWHSRQTCTFCNNIFYVGELTPEELQVSANLAQMWTNFATTGNPEFNAVPWKSTEPKYLKV